ncbi:MAG: hypothetical protein HC930_09970, partial [Hydrococcus sp. SU_1_0]|nr:hypothetical protein [Hydrococcus sp. SU_1_0]
MVRGSHQERYQSAAEVLEDLQQIDHNDPPPRKNDPTVPDHDVLKSAPPKKSLLLWIAIGLVGFGAIFASILAFSNKPQYVAYDNADYGIELERPKNWSLQEEDDLLEPGVILLSPQENNQDNFREKVKISIENLSKPLSLKEYTQQASTEIKNPILLLNNPKEHYFC